VCPGSAHDARGAAHRTERHPRGGRVLPGGKPEPYGEADLRLVSDLAARAAVHIDNARLYTREHATAVTLQRSLLARDFAPQSRRCLARARFIALSPRT
jgi:GAF domain-containing protein